MKCSQCEKPIIEADPNYVETAVGMNGITQVAPKYWTQRGTSRVLFCSPHCATEWNRHNIEPITTPTNGTENTEKPSKKNKKKKR
jgi:hypothetical protein